jgi:hypothetical protein
MPTPDEALRALEDIEIFNTRRPTAARLEVLRAFIEQAKAYAVDAARWRDLCSLTEYGHLCVLGKDDIQLDTARELEEAVDDDDAQGYAIAWRTAIAARSAKPGETT